MGGSSSDETVAVVPRKAEDVFAARETELLSAEVQVAKALGVLAKANRVYALAIELALLQSNKRKASQRTVPQGSKRPAAAASSGEDEAD